MVSADNNILSITNINKLIFLTKIIIQKKSWPRKGKISQNLNLSEVKLKREKKIKGHTNCLSEKGHAY